MGRGHAPELEDEPWFPAVLRDGLTAFLQVASERFGVFDASLPVLRGVLERHRATRIVDLCSGGGGPVLSMATKLPHVEVLLTDLYPNRRAFACAEARLGERVRGRVEPVDATDVSPDVVGVRTLFNALHHFRPADARRIFADAAHKRQPICAFEVVERRAATMATLATVPLAVLAFTPLSRPTPAQLALTYALPLIPLATGWDGFASCLRAYDLDELGALVDGIGDDGYGFSIGRAAGAGALPFRVTWLVGEPRAGDAGRPETSRP